MAKSDPGLGAGRSVSVPIESEISTPEKKVSVKEILIGLPVSSEEYEKLKVQAEKSSSKRKDHQNSYLRDRLVDRWPGSEKSDQGCILEDRAENGNIMGSDCSH